VFSNHDLKEFGSYVAIYDSNYNNFVPLAGVATTDANVGTVVLTQGSWLTFPYFLTGSSTEWTSINPIAALVSTGLADNLTVGSADRATLNYCNDEDYTNWTQISSTSTIRYAQYSPPFVWGGSSFKDIWVTYETSQSGGYTSTGTNVQIRSKTRSNVWLEETANITANGEHNHYLHSSNADPASEWDDNCMVYVRFNKEALDPNLFRFRNITVMRGYAEPTPNELFFHCKGLADTTGATYTGTASKLIENPSDVIRWFAMVKGGYSASDIDSSFTTERGNLSAWKYAFQWSDDTGIDNLFNYEGQRGIVDELAKQCNSIVWVDNLGKLKMRLFSPTDHFPTSETDVPADLDIFEYSGTPVGGSITRHPIYSFNLSPISIDETYTSFVLKYNQNYATNNYDSILTIDDGGGVSASVSTNITSSYLVTYSAPYSTAALALGQLKDLTSSCYTAINKSNTLTFEAWAIHDESTATKLLQRLVRWHARRRFRITLTTGLNAVGFELGDFINVRTDDIEDQFGIAFMNCKKWKITKISTDLAACKIEIEAVEAEIY
jgi:hypothetical protein